MSTIATVAIPEPAGIYVRHSPSALNMFAAEPAMFVLERILGLKSSRSASRRTAASPSRPASPMGCCIRKPRTRNAFAKPTPAMTVLRR